MTPRVKSLQGEGRWPLLPTPPPPQLSSLPGRGTLAQAHTPPACGKGWGGPHSLEQRNQTSRSACTSVQPLDRLQLFPQPRLHKAPHEGQGGWGAEVRQAPPFLCPLPSPQARAGYQDRWGLRWADGGTNGEIASLPARIWGDRDTGAQRESKG